MSNLIRSTRPLPCANTDKASGGEPDFTTSAPGAARGFRDSETSGMTTVKQYCDSSIRESFQGFCQLSSADGRIFELGRVYTKGHQVVGFYLFELILDRHDLRSK